MTTHPALPLSRDGIDSTAAPVAPASPPRTSSVVLVVLLLADVTLTAVLVGGQTWWLAAAAWVGALVLLLRTAWPRLV